MNGDNHDPSNGRFAPKGTGGGKKSLNDLKHTARRANLSPSGANSISVKAFGKKSHHIIHVNKHLKVEHEFKGMHTMNETARSAASDHLAESMMSPEEKNQYRLKKAVGLSGLG